MPQYQIPPWLRPADTAANYARGYGLGQQGAEAAARLQLEQLRMQAEQAHIQQELVRRQQELEVHRAFEQQKLDMAKQEMQQHQQEQQQAFEMQKQEFQVKAQQAARQSQAIGLYQQAIANGMDPVQAILQFGPAMGQQASPEAAAIRSMSTKPKPVLPPESTGQYAGEDFLRIPEPSGGMRFQQIHHQRAGPEGAITAEQRETLRSARTVLRDFEKEYGGIEGKMAAKRDPDAYKAAMAEAQDAAQEIGQILPNDPVAKKYSGQPQSPAASSGAVARYDPATKSFIPAGPPGNALTPQAQPPAGMTPDQEWSWMTKGMTPKPGQISPPHDLDNPQPAAPPTLPETKGGPTVRDQEIQDLRDELKKGGQGISKAAKDYLSDHIATLADPMLAEAAVKHGMPDIKFNNGEFSRGLTTEDANSMRSSGVNPSDPGVQNAMIDRTQVEDELYAAALENGWQGDWGQ